MAEFARIASQELKARSSELHCGDKILLTGVVYTARDAAHKRFAALLDEGKELPIPLKDAVIYSSTRTVTAVDVENIVIVETPDAIMVCRKDKAQEVKKIVDALNEAGRKELL